MRISRPVAAALGATAAASTAAGAWLQQAAGGPAPAGFSQYTAVAAGTAALGTFVLWQRPHNRYAATHLAIGVLFGTVVLAAGVLAQAGSPRAVPLWAAQSALAWSWLSAAALLPLWVIAIATFPDASFHRAVVKRATVGLAVVMPLLALVAYLFAPPGEPPPLVQAELPSGLAGPFAGAGVADRLSSYASASAAVLGSLAPVAAVVALLDRFRTAGAVLRQQIKWLLVGTAISVALQAIPVEAIDGEGARTLAQALVVLSAPLPLVAAGIAIFKHGLWEVDVVISKGLVYGLVSGVLTALFLGIALVAGVTVGGRDARVVAALGLALVVSFLAQPLRHRLESVVARVLYGDRPMGLMALVRLGEVGAAKLDARGVGLRIADVTRGALGSSWAGVWRYTPGQGLGTLKPLAVSGAEGGASAVVPAHVVTALTEVSAGRLFSQLPDEVAATIRPLFAEEPGLVAPLTSGPELIGLLACGPRPRDSYGDSDVDLAAVVARESALSLRNIGLEEELRDRLEEIERQAAELHSSRQRLVSAQDQERRRIERDLHDGAQQQLVALAARLRRAARAQGVNADRTLEELADEAEEAVFTLQELARGIYPSLLADRGLQAALQAHAARLPANVRVETEPTLHGRRLDPDLEAALYFVGLEAMTNAVKHAPAAHIVVSLRADPHKRTVTIEVHDDGPGFDPAAKLPRRGLQNMADRVAALGGVLSVESVPGGGTWIRAEVREAADVTDITSRGATP